MIQSVLLTALGFLIACLLALFAAPAFWARAVRLTTQRIRNSLPLTEAEIRADKDLMRAEYAVRVHQLSKTVEQSKLNAHRQLIEINRRDAQILRLQAEMDTVRQELSEQQNARGVLEQTFNDRLPKLEGGLEEARRLLAARDEIIGRLNATAERQMGTLTEARTIHAQQQAEIERLRGALATAQSQDRRRVADYGTEIEFALRTELETLRARSREQDATIIRLQDELGLWAGTAAAAMGGNGAEATDEAGLRGKIAEQAAEIRQLRREIAQQAELTAGAATNGEAADALVHLQQIRGLEAKTRDQADEIRRLRSEAEAMRASLSPDASAAVRESKSWLKSRLERLEREAAEEREKTGRLRAELASANERSARQASYFRDEMRRLGTRTLTPARPSTLVEGTSDQAVRNSHGHGGGAAVVPLVARITGSAPNGPATVSDRARELQKTLHQRMSGEGRRGAGLSPVELPAAAVDGNAVADGSVIHASEAVPAPLAANGHGEAPETTASAIDPEIQEVLPEPAVAAGNSADPAPAETPAASTDDVASEAGAAKDAGERRGRLLDRLRSYEES